MIKLSRTGITTLKRQYKSVLLKCLLINAGILLAAGSANAVVSIDTSGLTVDTSTGATDQAVAGTATISGLGTMAEATASDYYTKTEVNDALALKADASTTYTKTEVNDALALKADASTTYTKTEVNDALALKANAADVYAKTETYSKTEVNDALALKADASTTYTKTEVDNGFVKKDLSNLTDGQKNAINSGITTELVGKITANETAITGLDTRVTTAEGKITTAEGKITTLEGKVANHTASFTTLAGIIDGGTVSADGVYTAGTALSAYDSATTLTAVVNKLAENKQEQLTSANAGNGISITGTDPVIAVNLGTKSGLDFASGGLVIKNGDTTTVSDEGFLNIKYGSQFTSDENGLKLNANAVNTAELATGAVTSVKLADNAVTADKINAEAVTSAKIATNAVTADKINAEAVTEAKIAAGAVTNTKIADEAVTTAKLADEAVTDAKLADNAVTTAKIADDAVTNDKLADNAVDTAQLVDGAVTEGKLADNAVTTNKISDGNVTFAKLADAAVDKDGSSINAGTDTVLTTGAAVKAAAQNADFKAGGSPVDLADGTIAQAINTLDTAKATLTSGKTNTFESFNIFKNDNGIRITDGAGTAGLEANLKIDTTTITGKKLLNIVAPDDGIYTEQAISSAAGLNVISADGTKEYLTADSTMLEIGDGTDTKFKVTNASGNIETAGTLTLGSTTGAGATLTGTETDLTSNVKVVSANGFEVDANNSFLTGAFKLAGTEVNTINTTGLDRGVAGEATDLATMAATVATINAQAEDGVYTNSVTDGSNITHATLNFALADLDREMGADSAYTSDNNGVSGDASIKANIDAINIKLGNVADVEVNGYDTVVDLTEAVSTLNNNMNTVLGDMYADDGSYTKFAAAKGFVDGADLTAQLTDYAANVETATGGQFDDTGAWAATVDNSATNGYNYTESADLMDAISQVAGNVGTADDLTDLYNGVDTDNSVNANINAVNATIGDITTLNKLDDDNSIGNAMTNGTGVAPTTVVEALNNIDATLGTIHGLARKLESEGIYQGNLANGTTVEQHLTALDAAIGDRSQFAGGRYVAGAESVSDAVMSLDQNLDALSNKVRDFKKEFKSGMAQMAAMSALVPNARAHGNTQISVGTGAYDGQTAAAIGGFHWVNDNLLLNIGASYGDSNNMAYRAGLTWSW